MSTNRIYSLKDKIRPLWFKVVRKWLASRIRLQRLANKFELHGVSSNPWIGKRKSDTLFILGSGLSINEISTDEWAQIANHDSVGFNNWMLHSFVPTFFVTEPGKDLNILSLEYRNFVLRDYGKTQVPILIKDAERYRYVEMLNILKAVPADLLAQMQLSWDWESQVQEGSFFRKQLKQLNRFGLLDSPFCPSLRKRASVFNLVVLAMRAGYKEIVLCGVDLNAEGYFFDKNRFALQEQGYWLPPQVSSEGVHKTNDPEFGELTIDQALIALRDEVLNPREITIQVAFKSSALYPSFPSYFRR